jgi:hypothetical protein
MTKGAGEGQSLPPYPHYHSGPCLVVGNAACLPDDIEKARRLFPDAPVIAVNGAAAEVKAFALYSYHPERFIKLGWLERQVRKFGPGFTVHATRGLRSPNDTPCSHVDHWWPDATGSGGSAWGARKVAGMMGFSPVILVGCPLEAGPYVNGSAIGGLMHRADVADDMLRGIEGDTRWHAGCLSMSGRTRQILGGP